MFENQDLPKEREESVKALKSLMVSCAISHLYFKTHSEQTCSVDCHEWLAAMARQREQFVNQLELVIYRVNHPTHFLLRQIPQFSLIGNLPRLDQLRSSADRRLLLQSLQHERLLIQHYRCHLNRIWSIDIRSTLSSQQAQIHHQCSLIIDLLANSDTFLT